METPVHWRHYASVLWDRKWVLITVLVVTLTATVVWLQQQTPVYRASTRIKVDYEGIRLLNIQTVSPNESQDWQQLNTIQHLLQSRALATDVVEKMNLRENKDFLDGAPPEAAVGVLQRSLRASLVRESRLMDIVVEHPKPAITALVANGVAETFIQQNIDRKVNDATEAVKRLRKEANEFQANVRKSEEALQAFREANNGISLEERQHIIVNKLNELNTAVTNASTARLQAEVIWKDVEAALKDNEKLSAIPAISNESQVVALRQKLADKRGAIATLSQKYKDAHPAMAQARAELQELTQSLATARQEAAQALHSNYLNLKANEVGLRAAVQEQDHQALDLYRKLVDYNDLKRNADADQKLYESILGRIREAGATERLQTNDVHIVDLAVVPGGPFKPQKTRLLLVGAVFGLFLGILLSLLADYYDDKIKTHEDIEQFLRLPLLACVPHISGNNAVHRNREVETQPKSIAAEAFRNLRATISLGTLSGKAKILLVTSAGPGEGKSLVASNLGTVLANNNLRTLIIDADLRRPTQEKVYAIGSPVGLSKFLANGGEDILIYPTGVQNLDVIVAGAVPPNPPELLGSAKMRALLAEMEKRYDRIIVDSPPITAVSDALLLLPHVHGVVMVVHRGKVRRDIVARALQKLRESDVPILGAVLNNVDVNKNGYYYYPYHYSYYDKPDRTGQAAETKNKVG